MLFIETPVFTKKASGGLFTDAELRQLQQQLLEDPTQGDLIRGAGGLRKIRLARTGGGKSGGFRILYYCSTPELIFFLLAYPKSKKDNLSKTELKILRQLIEGEEGS